MSTVTDHDSMTKAVTAYLEQAEDRQLELVVRGMGLAESIVKTIYGMIDSESSKTLDYMAKVGLRGALASVPQGEKTNLNQWGMRTIILMNMRYDHLLKTGNLDEESVQEFLQSANLNSYNPCDIQQAIQEKRLANRASFLVDKIQSGNSVNLKEVEMALIEFRGFIRFPKNVASHSVIEIDGEDCLRIRYGNEYGDWGADRQPCYDCGCVKGEYHMPTCIVERCPSCKQSLWRECKCTECFHIKVRN